MTLCNIACFYDELLRHLITRYPILRDRGTRLFKVLHAFDDKVPLIQSLIQHDLLAGVVLKNSSSQCQSLVVSDIQAMMRGAEIPLNHAVSTYNRGDLETYNYKEDTPIIIGDHGGYFASNITTLSKRMGRQLMGMTEHTLNGEMRLFQQALLGARKLPYISTARLDLKDRSDREIAHAIADEMSSLAYNSGGHDLYNANTNATILLIGYGNMGMYTAQKLKEQNLQARLWVHDIQSKKLAFAMQDGFLNVCYDFEDVLDQADIIVLATNTIRGDVPVLSPHHFGIMKKDVCITSMTSLDDEINMPHLLRNGVLERIGNEGEAGVYRTAQSGRVKLLLDGKPTNVRLKNGGAQAGICMVEAAGLVGAFKIAEHGFSAGLSDEDSELICSLWLKYFHRDQATHAVAC